MRQCHMLSILLFLFVVTEGLFTDEEPEVRTKWGSIRGKWSNSTRSRRIANFLGIPYAEPPLADLRFKSPQRWNRAWTETLNATVDGNECSRIDLNGYEYKIYGSEDCLYLNVFVPELADNKMRVSTKLPVLVFVHGGGYMGGSSNSRLYAPDYLLNQDIVLVTFNYRLNILGFFNTANRASPGNYGIKDMRLALEWVQENIHSFNGDAKSVTLMGTSAGSGAVHLLALSNKTEGLFSKYILLSGSALGPWNVHASKLYRRTCLEVARSLGCLPNEMIVMNKADNSKELENNRTGNIYDYIFSMNDNNTLEDDEEMMRCMRSADIDSILNTIPHLYVWRDSPMCLFGPVIEEDSTEAIVTMNPMEVIKKGLFRDIPAMMQVVKDEGLAKTSDFFAVPEIKYEMIENFDELLLYLTEFHEIVTNTSSFAALIKEFYFSKNITSDTYDYARKITDMTGDSVITWPVFQAVKYQSKIAKSNLYFSFFDYKGTFSFSFITGKPVHYGIFHGDDLNYIFPLLNNMYKDMYKLHNTENDQMMINIMTEFYTNFMKNGVPEAWMIREWPAYRNNHQFMRLGIGGSSDITVQADFLRDRMEFWEELTANLSIKLGVGRDIGIDRTTSINNIGTNEYKLLTHLTLLTVTFVTLSIYIL